MRASGAVYGSRPHPEEGAKAPVSKDAAVVSRRCSPFSALSFSLTKVRVQGGARRRRLSLLDPDSRQGGGSFPTAQSAERAGAA